MTIRIATGTLLITTAVLLAGAQEPAPLRSGVYSEYMDTSVRPQDDFYQYVNGGWLARAEMPANRTRIGTWNDVRDRALKNVQDLIEEAGTGAAKDPAARQIADLYASFMDEARLEALGAEPLRDQIARIDAVRTPEQLSRRIGELAVIGVGGMSLGVGTDFKDPTTTILQMGQWGMTLLPDRDYYLKDDPKLAQARAAYRTYLEQVFTLLKRPDPAAAAASVVKLEAAIATAQWPLADTRDPVRMYNPYAPAALPKEFPGFNWTGWAGAQGFERLEGPVLVAQPSFFKSYAALTQSEPLDAWKALLVAQLASHYAPYLNKAFVDTHFEFFNKALRGQQAPRPRAELAAMLVDRSLGELLGRLYVQKYFPPAAKVRMLQMVDNLREAYRQSIQTSGWMTPRTREQALAKLSQMAPQIGYPDKWKSYDKIVIEPDDLAGNVIRLARFEQRENAEELGRPVDREKWRLPPQTVNAFYNATLNAIVFPAGILQPPFFDAAADDAVNYGAIGSVIGHEIGHGFDDQGRKFDGAGAMRDWWVAEDDTEFKKRAQRLVEQFNAFAPLPDMRINGALTLGENIGDLAGVGIAYKAYKLSLKEQPAPVLDGFTGDQRFFIGFAQVWREKRRDDAQRVQLLSDSHSPARYRTNGVLPNLDAFHAVFGVKPSDRMFLASDQRVRIW